MRILIVDDEPNALELMTRALTRDGHAVDTASSGDDAWRQLQAARFDCVVADLRMPGMDGQELHRLTRETDPEQASRFIFLTGDTFSAETLAFAEATSEAPLLMKPVDLAALRLWVKTVPEAIAKSQEHRSEGRGPSDRPWRRP